MKYLTSFRMRHELHKVELYSAAIYQPKGYNYPEADCFKITGKDGRWIRPREFIQYKNPVSAYTDALMRLYDSRSLKISKFLKRSDAANSNIALCCWCPYERAAQRQLKEWGSFICHLSVIGWWLHYRYKKIPVWLDRDRLQMTVLTQKGGYGE